MKITPAASRALAGDAGPRSMLAAAILGAAPGGQQQQPPADLAGLY
jgi:hypothetical protein